LTVEATALERLLKLGEVEGDEGEAVGGSQLIEEGALVVAELVAAGFDLDATAALGLTRQQALAAF
jgi:hypothetical protein